MAKKCFLFLSLFWLIGSGRPEAFAFCAFEGHVDFVKQKFDLKVFFKNGGSLQTQGTGTLGKSFSLDTKLDHVKVARLDLVTQIKGSVEFMHGTMTESFLRGEINSRYSLLNYKPVGELSGYFEIRKGRLYLTSVSWGGVICDGYLGLLPPYDVDLTIRFSEINLTDLLVLFGLQTDEHFLAGDVSGRIKLLGFWDKLMLKGSLAARDGFIRDLEYDDILANFEGVYPIIHIAESNITEASGLSFNIDGDLNLADSPNFIKGLSLLKMSPLVDEGSVYRDWTIKRKHEEGKKSTTELKYRLQKGADEGIRPEDGSDMLGFENRIKF